LGSVTSGAAQTKDYETAVLPAIIGSIVLSMTSITFQAGVTRTNTSPPTVMTTSEFKNASQKASENFNAATLL